MHTQFKHLCFLRQKRGEGQDEKGREGEHKRSMSKKIDGKGGWITMRKHGRTKRTMKMTKAHFFAKEKIEEERRKNDEIQREESLVSRSVSAILWVLFQRNF